MIADSSAWIEYLRDTGSVASERLRQVLERNETLWMPSVVYGEVLQGARTPHHFAHLQMQLDKVPALVLADSHETARASALLYAKALLRAARRTA